MKNELQTVLFDSQIYRANCILDNGYVSHSKRHFMLTEFCGQPASILLTLDERISDTHYRASALCDYQIALCNRSVVPLEKLVECDQQTNMPLSGPSVP